MNDNSQIHLTLKPRHASYIEHPEW